MRYFLVRVRTARLMEAFLLIFFKRIKRNHFDKISATI